MLSAIKVGRRIKLAVGVAILFVLVALRANIDTAAWFIACGVVGYINAFYVIRAILVCAKGGGYEKVSLIVAPICILASAAIAYFGHGLVLAMFTMGFVLIDAVILRFK